MNILNLLCCIYQEAQEYLQIVKKKYCSTCDLNNMNGVGPKMVVGYRQQFSKMATSYRRENNILHLNRKAIFENNMSIKTIAQVNVHES